MSNKTETIQALYDNAAETYSQIIERTHYIGPQWLLQNLHLGFQATNGLRILDLGCANGINIANLYQINQSIAATGVDISQKMIEKARETGLYLALHHQGLDEGLTFGAINSYDMVIALGCLEFVNDLASCLQEIARVCTEQAYFYASFQRFEPDNPAAPRKMRSGEVTHFAYSQSEIGEMLLQAGFEITTAEALIGYTGGAPCPYLLVVAQKSKGQRAA